MSEWRTLPEFPDYQVTSDGEVRNKWSLKQLKEIENKTTGAYHYSLRRPDGRSTCRNYWGLVTSAFPEYAEEKVVKVLSTRAYCKRNQWVDIPGFPTYQAHPDGLVRYRVSKRHRKVLHDKKTGVPYFRLFNEDGESNNMRATRILRMCFPEQAEQDVA